MRNWLIGFLVVVPVLGMAAEEWHTFTNRDGRKLVAKILSVDVRSVTVELKANGRHVPIEFDELTEEDVDYVQTSDLPEPASKTMADATPVGMTGANRLYPRTREEIREGIRKIEKAPRAEGVSKEVDLATRQLNIYRFLCGLPSDVKPDAEFSKAATDAALACKKNGGLSHGIGHSTDRCNLTTVANLSDSVVQFMADNGDNNRDARGHRAWCLNPPMGKVGFGSGGDSYAAMWCMDSSGQSVTGTWAYPGKGLFPLEYMHGNAWSLYGAGGAGPVSQFKVDVVRLSKRPTQAFPASGEIPGHPLKINHVSSGMNCLNFEPSEPNKRGIYWVRVTGNGITEGYLVELY